MSAEPERLFSSAKITITDRKNRLQFESIEAIDGSIVVTQLGQRVRYSFKAGDIDIGISLSCI